MITSPRDHKRAFALLSVLGLITVLTLLLSALIGNNQSAFHLLRQGQAQDRLDRTENTVFAYCRMKLEHDFTWGRDSFSGTVTEMGQLTVVEEPDATGTSVTQSLRGVDLSNNTEFEVELCNNLSGEVTLSEDLDSRLRDGVPPGFCRLRITSFIDTKQRRVEVMTRNPGLIGAGLLSNGKLSVAADGFRMYTKDPVKNQVRSLADIDLDGMGDLFFDPLSTAPPAGASSHDPVVWSGGATRFRDAGSGDWKDRDDFNAQTSQALREEKFREHARASFEIPEVDLSEIAEVTGPGDSTKETRNLDSGVYEFQQTTMNGDVVRILARRQSPNGTSMSTSQGAIERFWYFSEADRGPGYPTPSQVAARINAPSSATGSDHKGNQRVQINADGGATLDLLNRNIVLDERYNFQVDGDFGIRAKQISGAFASHAKLSLIFADPRTISSNGTVSITDNVTAAEESQRHHGDLRSTSGRIHIEGDIAGSATLAAEGDVNLELSRFNDTSGNSCVDFSIFSGGDVTFNPPDITQGGGSNYVSQDEITVTGLIYAKGAIDLDLGQYKDSPTKRRFNMEGAIVAGSGDLNISNVSELNLVYNPQFVDRILAGRLRDNQRRIEVTGWKPL